MEGLEGSQVSQRPVPRPWTADSTSYIANFIKGTAFGTPTSRYAYQYPRSYDFSVGFRF